MNLFGLVMVVNLSQSLCVVKHAILLYVQNLSDIGYMLGWLAWVTGWSSILVGPEMFIMTRPWFGSCHLQMEKVAQNHEIRSSKSKK